MRWITEWEAAEARLWELEQPALHVGKEHGFRLLKMYRERGLGGVKGEPEKRFSLPFPSPNIPVPLLGFIDLAVPDERHFRDFKTTGGDGWNQTKVDLEPQVHAYGWAYQQLYRHRAERALWIILSTNKRSLDVYETVPSPDGFRLFEKQAEATWNGIVAGRYEGCGECPELCKPVEPKSSTGPSIVWATS
jgi:hypothetical protein